MKNLYQTNKDFKDYVDRYSKKYVEGISIPVEEALTHAIIKSYAEDLESRKE